MNSHYSSYLLLSKISAFFVVVPILFGTLRLRRFKTAEKALYLLACISLIVETTALALHSRHYNDMNIARIYTIIEFTVLSIFFISVISWTKVVWTMKVLIGLFVITGAMDWIFTGGSTMDSLSTTIESVVFIIYCLILFYFLFKEPPHNDIIQTSVFWFNAGILLYFSGSLFVFIFGNYLQRHANSVLIELWGIHSVINILFYLLISIGFWKTVRT